MADDKKMNELTDDELEQAAGGIVRKVPGIANGWRWEASSDEWGPQHKKKTFSTEAEAKAYAKGQGWNDTTLPPW